MSAKCKVFALSAAFMYRGDVLLGLMKGKAYICKANISGKLLTSGVPTGSSHDLSELRIFLRI